MKQIYLIPLILLSFVAGVGVVYLRQVPPVPEVRTGRIEIISRTSEEQQNIKVYKEYGPAVVYISTVMLTVDPMDLFPEVHQQQGAGSGIIIDAKQGLVVTNLHVIKDAAKISIVLAEGSSHGAKLLGYDEEYDLAVLKIRNPPDNLISIPFGNSSSLEVGQRVLAIGNPFGLDRTLTTGIISSLSRTIKNPNGLIIRDLIQTDAAINPGNSGGPLLNTNGQLIGINTAILSQSGDSAGIGFAIPINNINKILPDLITKGKVLRPFVGWLLADTNQGPMVRRVLRGSPAEKAGLKPFERFIQRNFLQGYIRDYDNADLVIAYNGKVVKTKEEVEDLLAAGEKGQEFELTLRTGGRYGDERKVTVKPKLQ